MDKNLERSLTANVLTTKKEQKEKRPTGNNRGKTGGISVKMLTS